jgi:predicted ATPase
MSRSQQIGSRFRIDDLERDLLGRGGMGAVYRGTDIHTGEFVAVKALDPHVVARDPELLERFIREGEALRQLNHPNIVRMVAAVEEQGHHYLVMEYVPAGSLRDLLEATRPDRFSGNLSGLSTARAVEIALDLADALTRAHRLGILHRDLKPENVLLAGDGTPRLADFGLARLAASSRLTQSGMLMGTVDYVSPEACEGEQADERSDIWSFGVMLFEMLAGCVPFSGDTFVARLNAILTQPVPDLGQLAPGVPDGLADLVYRMLEKDPQQRIPSVRLVGAELEALLKGREAVAPARAVPAESRSASPTPPALGPRHNLPAQTTPFIGRQAELVELARLLEDPAVRLVSIVGLGGMGKTRLALEVAAAQLDRFKHGVYLVPLAPLQAAEAIVPTIAGALGFAFRGAGDPRQQLLDHLRDKALLLILDNFEHLLEGADLVTDLLHTAPGLKILATTRVRLNVQGEQIFQLAAMDLPDLDTAADAASYSAVKLFLQSARRVRPCFELDTDSLGHIARICRLVGGMPLGILLAAAWAGMLTPAEIAEEIGQSLDFLKTDLRDLPERQRSLRAVFDHSWKLLTEREREVFRGLSVFRGGFTREAAQQVTGASLRELRGLVDKSLLQRAPTGRYEVHDLLRQYAAERLVQSGEEDASRGRHLEYYLSIAEQSLVDTIGPMQPTWLRRMLAENDNIRAALGWSLASGRTVTGLRLAASARFFWFRFTYLAEGRGWLERLLDATPEPTIERARGLEALGHLVHVQGDYPLSFALCKQSLDLSEALGDRQAVADASFRLSWPAIALGENVLARQLLERSLALYQDMNRPSKVARVLSTMGELARAEGDALWAREVCEESFLLDRRSGSPSPYISTNLAMVLIHFGELDRSRDLLKESLALIREVGSMESDSGAALLMAAGFLANARGQPVRAVRLLSASEALVAAKGNGLDAGDRPDHERNLASLRAQLEAAAFEAAWAEGAALTPEQAVVLAFSDEP